MEAKDCRAQIAGSRRCAETHKRIWAFGVTNLQLRVTYIEPLSNLTAYNHRCEENLSARSKPPMYRYTHPATAGPQRTGFIQ